MKVLSRSPIGPTLLGVDTYSDSRGKLDVGYQTAELEQLLGLRVDFKQQNLIHSHARVARGLHYTTSGQNAKLVHPICGTHFSVAVDVRRGSPTAGEWVGQIVGPARAFYVPKGFAHGVLALFDGSILQYHATEIYDATKERSLAIDSDVGIEWPLPIEQIVANDRDLKIKALTEFWSTYD